MLSQWKIDQKIFFWSSGGPSFRSATSGYAFISTVCKYCGSATRHFKLASILALSAAEACGSP